MELNIVDVGQTTFYSSTGTRAAPIGDPLPLMPRGTQTSGWGPSELSDVSNKYTPAMCGPLFFCFFLQIRKTHSGSTHQLPQRYVATVLIPA
jgi:hypothetical protein